MPVPPTLVGSGSISAFGKDLVIYYSVVETVGSGFLPLAQTTFFLTSLRNAGIQIDSYMDRVRAIAPNAPVPPSLLLQNLVVHIADIREYQPPLGTHVINRVQTRNERRPAPSNETSLTRRPPASTPRHLLAPPPPNRPFRTGADCQCPCCGRWGHARENCMQLCTTYLCMQYIAANGDFCAAQAIKWNATQKEKTAQQNGVIRMLRYNQPDFYATQTDEDIRASLADAPDSDFV